jgi:carbon starvation protein
MRRPATIMEAATRRYGDIWTLRLPAGVNSVGDAARMAFNDYLDAAVAAFFMVAVVVILADSIREWTAVLRGRKPAVSTEVPFEARAAVAGD